MFWSIRMTVQDILNMIITTEKLITETVFGVQQPKNTQAIPEILNIASYLAIKELLRNKGRFFLISLVIALITLLVLFIAALGEGLGNGNREYISKLDAELIVFQAKSDFVISASRLGSNRLAAIRRVEGVADAGGLYTSNAAVVFLNGNTPIKTALLGVEAGKPGEPGVVEGRQFRKNLANEVILDKLTALRTDLLVGDTLLLRTTQGDDDKFFELQVVGISDGQQYGLQPSVFVPYQTWENIRSKSSAEVGVKNPLANAVIIKLTDSNKAEEVKSRLLARVENIEVATLDETVKALPGYTAQQSTLNTQGAFTLIIGILVIGGFFQIQVLQKVNQIGVLKAIGTSTPAVAVSSIIQIVLVTMLGVFIGAFFTYLLSLTFPPTVPIVFNGSTSAIAVVALILIGPLGGLVSINYAARIEPLKALGLSS